MAKRLVGQWSGSGYGCFLAGWGATSLALVGLATICGLSRARWIWGVVRVVPFFMLIGLIFALAAWDLTIFKQRLRQTGEVEAETTLEIDHLRRLGIVAGLGLLLGLVALTIQFQLTLLWALLLGFLIIIGLGRVIKGVRDHE